MAKCADRFGKMQVGLKKLNKLVGSFLFGISMWFSQVKEEDCLFFNVVSIGGSLN